MPITRDPHPLALRDAIADRAADWLLQHLGRKANLCADSRRLVPGDGFMARAGRHFSAEAHLEAAMDAGAGAMLIDAGPAAEDLQEVTGRVPLLRVPQLAHRMGMIASAFYGRPSMTLQIVAVTGTNGKSTVTAALGHALARSGIPAAVIGTLGLGIFPAFCSSEFEPAWDDQWTAGLTTPDAVDLQRILRELKSREIAAVAIEASSIGIEQGRLQGCAIKAAAFTNLSHDHLDIHGTMERYAQAKALLFEAPSLGTMVINTDDPYAALMWQATELHIDRIAIGSNWPSNANGAIKVGRAEPSLQGWRLMLEASGLARDFAGDLALPVFGHYNIDNALIVAGCMLAMGLDAQAIRRRLTEFKLPAGRLQMLTGLGPWACVDYAHSPDALARVLEALRPIAQARAGRLICVFGCGGDRDPSKRPIMGEIAARLADHVVLTSDNPRRESPETILDAIVAGVPDTLRQKVQRQSDRALAIAQAIANADGRDLILIAGKGHEQTQTMDGETILFGDVDHARRAQALWKDAHGIREARVANG